MRPRPSPPVKVEDKSASPSSLPPRQPFDALRREVERLCEDFDRYLRSPFRRSVFDVGPFLRRELGWGAAPAVDVIEKDEAYEITAEIPGIDAKDIEVKVSSSSLTIKGEKQEQKYEKKQDYCVRERGFGAFERHFSLPAAIDPDKINANFKKGILTITLPKTHAAWKAQKKIEVKAA